jgi:pimeloyl-ACP methyl ester carboxylesterase
MNLGFDFDFDFAVFPKPSKPSYSLYNPNLIWLSRPKSDLNEGDPSSPTDIPCLFLPYSEPSNKLMIYFHGNSEDIGDTELLFFALRPIWRCHVLCVEYPSYGQYKPHPPLSEETIYNDAEMIYQQVLNKFSVKESQIIVFGRSLGTAPAVHLASIFKPAAVVLISPFCSIKAAAGALSFQFLANFVKERFNNQSKIQLVNSPLLIIHGMKDTLVPVQQGQTLIDLALSEKKRLITPPDMTHSEFDLVNDLGIPVSRFLAEISENNVDLGKSVMIPAEEIIDWERFFNAHRVPTFPSTVTEKPIEAEVFKSAFVETEAEVGSTESPENLRFSWIDEKKQ